MSKASKILIAILILGSIFVFPAASQQWTKENLQNAYIEYLTQEGFTPTVDEDGDVKFKVAGDTYFIIVDDKDIQFFQIYTGFKLDTVSQDAAINAANSSNRISKVVKIAFSPERKIVSITAELLLNDPKDFVNVFSRAISLIRNAENNFMTQLKTFNN
jgi:hypothetical protein